MQASRFVRLATLPFLIFALQSYATGFDPPKFIVDSAPPENLKLEITEYVTLIVPEIEKQLLETSAEKFTDRIIAVCADPSVRSKTTGRYGRFEKLCQVKPAKQDSR